VKTYNGMCTQGNPLKLRSVWASDVVWDRRSSDKTI